MSDLAKGDQITYAGTLGQHSGFVAEVKNLIDESGTKLRAFVAQLEGLGRVLTSGDALSKVEQAVTDIEDVVTEVEGGRKVIPATIEIPRSAYSDTTVPAPVEPTPAPEPEPASTEAPATPEPQPAEETPAPAPVTGAPTTEATSG